MSSFSDEAVLICSYEEESRPASTEREEAGGRMGRVAAIYGSQN